MLIKKIKSNFKSLISQMGTLDYVVLAFMLSIVASLIFIYSLGYYCYSENNKIIDCPAEKFTYTGKPFWSWTAITSAFIHNDQFHLMNNIGVFLVAVLFGYVVILANVRGEINYPLRYFNVGLLLAFLVSLLLSSYLGMVFFSKTSLFGLPTYGFSGVSYAIFSYVMTFLLAFPLSKINVRNVKHIISIVIIVVGTYVLFRYLTLLAVSKGNSYVHVVGIILGSFVAVIIYFAYSIQKQKPPSSQAKIFKN